jgi:hypothetical protein
MKRLVFSILTTLSLVSVPIAQAADIQGTFLLVPQQSDNVAQKVESTVSNMNLFIRSFARNKISKAARANQKVSIALSDNGISILADDNLLPVTPTDGTTLTYRNREGDILGLRTRMNGNKLEQTFITDKGSRTNVCELSDDGNILEMRVVIKSEYFDKPMTYKLVYHKSS